MAQVEYSSAQTNSRTMIKFDWSYLCSYKEKWPSLAFSNLIQIIVELTQDEYPTTNTGMKEKLEKTYKIYSQ